MSRAYDSADRLPSTTAGRGNKTTFDADSDWTTTFTSSTGKVDTDDYTEADQLTSIALGQGVFRRASGIETPGWLRPFLNVTGNAPYLGLTATPLSAYQWETC